MAKFFRADLDGSNVEPAVIAGGAHVGLAIDTVEGKIYWTSQSDCVPCGSIARADLDGSNREFLIFDLIDPEEIEIDPAAGKLYFADQDQILQANLDGSALTELIGGQQRPWGLALDLEGGGAPVPATRGAAVVVAAIVLLTVGSMLLARRRVSRSI